MKFDKNKFLKEKDFFIIAILIVVVFLVLSIFFGTSGKKASLKEKDLESGEVVVNKLVINEIMTANKGAYLDSNGNLYDYVEIYNGTSKDVNLKNYGLSDVANKIKWTFPNAIVKRGEYLVVFLSGSKINGLYVNFKLKSGGGETLTLRNPNGKTIDAVTTVGLSNNYVMARDLNGSWIIQTKPTPGYANTVEGHNLFLKSLISNEENSIVINEILPNNKGYFTDNYDSFSGYIEVINIGNETINLKGYSLSNDDSINFRWQFPDLKIKKGEVVLVYTSNRNITEGILHANFKLNNFDGVVVLANSKGQVVDSVKYSSLSNGLAYIRGNNGFFKGSSISPGYINNTNGIEKFNSTIKTKDTLIINEAMNSNYKYMAQNGGRYYDWIELKNNSNSTIKLSDYYLTTSTDNMNMYKLPDVELKKGEYYIIMASGNTKLSNSSYKHANFKLGDIEGIYLVKNNKIVDSLFMADVLTGYSVGKGNSSGIFYYSSPTPKAKNNKGQKAIAFKPDILKEAGIYNDVKNISVEIKGEGTIYYTLDGSKPTTSSKVYKGPLTLSKTSVVKAISVESGKLNSEVVANSYIINENHILPVMSVSLKQSDFSYLSRNAWVTGLEVAAYAEFFENGKEGFEIPCALQLFGGSTRGHAKKSFEIVFKKKYGEGELEYQVFDNRDFSVFNSLVLRTGSQDEQAPGDRHAIIRDLVTTSLVDKYTNVDVQAYKSTILYINGNYWGIYYIREKVDATFVDNNYNVSGEKSDILRIDGNVKSGSSTKYNNMLNYIKTHSMSNQKYYEEIKKQIDIENLIDFWIAETWTTNNDIVNCRYFSNPYVDNGKWHFIFYDLDYSMYHPEKNYFQFSTSSSGMTFNHYSTFLLRNLMKNKEFKNTYIERLSYNLKNTWSTANVNAMIDQIYNELQPEMKRNLDKWGYSYNEWKNQVNYLKTFTKQRQSYIRSQAKSFFGLSSSKAKELFG